MTRGAIRSVWGTAVAVGMIIGLAIAGLAVFAFSLLT